MLPRPCTTTGDLPQRAWLWAWSVVVAQCLLLLLPGQSLAFNIGGSLSWDFARSQSNTKFADAVQLSFAQSYRTHMSSALLNPNIGQLSAGASWRRDLSNISGSSSNSDRDVRLTNFNVGLVLIPRLMPISINFRRALVEDKNGDTVGTNNLSSTVSLSTRVPMWDGEPLAVSAHQTTQDGGDSTQRSRLLSLNKRFNFGASSYLNSTYRFSEFDSQNDTERGHSVALTEHTRWSDRLSSSVFGNLSTRTSTIDRRAGGRSLFVNNSYGGTLHYRNGRVSSASLQYNYSETPQSQAKDLQNHQLTGSGSRRLGTKTDVDGNFSYRRLSLSTGLLTTRAVNVGLRHRPTFGWSVGGRLGVSDNLVKVGITERRQTYYGSGFLSGRKDTRPVELRWGSDVGYSTTNGNLSQDRMRSSAHLSVTEKQLRRVKLTGKYRISEAREVKPGRGLTQIDVQHDLTMSATLRTIRSIFMSSDSLGATFRAASHWSRRDDLPQTIRGQEAQADAHYIAWAGLAGDVGIKLAENSDDIAGGSRVMYASASWARRVLRRGTGKLSSSGRTTHIGGKYDSSEVSVAYSFSYAIGLVHASLTADAKRVDLGGNRFGSSSNSVRVNVTRTF